MIAPLLLWVAAALGAVAPEVDLTADMPGRTREVDASKRILFGYQWRQPLVRTGFLRKVATSFGKPAVDKHHGLIIVGTGEGEVRALAIKDGRTVWSYVHGEPFEGAATLVEIEIPGRYPPIDAVILGSRDGTLVALTVDRGELVWKADVEADVRAPVAVGGDLIVVQTSKNRVLGLDKRTGASRWSAGRAAPTKLTVVGHARPLVHDGAVYASFSDGHVESYDLATGAPRWSRPLSIKGGEFLDADADPQVHGGKLFVASYSDGVYALRMSDGQTVWQRSAPAVRSLAVGENLVWAGSGDGWIFALSPDDGALVGRTHLTVGMATRMEVRDGLVVLGGGDTGLVVLSAKPSPDGKVAVAEPLQATGLGTRLHGDPTWSDDVVALLSSPGYLYAFRFGEAGLVR